MVSVQDVHSWHGNHPAIIVLATCYSGPSSIAVPFALESFHSTSQDECQLRVRQVEKRSDIVSDSTWALNELPLVPPRGAWKIGLAVCMAVKSSC